MKKKFYIIFVSIISVLCLAFGLSACSKVEFKVSFVVDGQTVHTINTNGNEIISMPPDPQKDDYIFDGWYWDKDVWEKPFTANSLLDAPLSSNMNVYCKWRPEHEHAFAEEVVEDQYKASGASCTEKSKYYYSCACGEIGTATFEYGELLPHTEETITGTPASCTESGLTDGKKCSVCGTTLQEQTTIPVKAHTEETIMGKPATCTVDGLTDGKKCSVCHTVLIEQKTIPAAHTPTAWIIDRNSTCTEKGSRHKECVVCGSTLTTEEIALVPHTETTIYGKVPTCTNSGLTNGRICSVCGTTTAEQTIIPATGHKYDDGVCLACGAEQAPATISEVTGATIDDLDIYMFVEHDVTEVNLLRIVTCSPKSTWKLYEDKRGQYEIATKIASGENDELNNGANEFYIVATSANGIDVNTYTLTIYRSYKVTINYYHAGNLDRTDSAYTGYEYTVDYTPEYRGYTFYGWKNGGETFTNAVLWDNLVLNADETAHTFTASFITEDKAQTVNSITVAYDQEVTLPASCKTGYTFNGWLLDGDLYESAFAWNFIEDKEFTAKFTANTDTLYTVKHIGQNITDDEFDTELLIEELHGTSDSKVTPAVKSFTGFTSPQLEEITIAPDGSTVLIYYYTRNSYTLTLCANSGTENTTQTLKYEAQVPSAERQGYTFGGWFTDIALTQNVSIIPANDLTVYAWWQEENKANDFTYTLQETVTITGYNGSATAVTVPTYIGGIAVTDLATNAFRDKNTLPSVTIPDSVTRIGDYAFYHCSGLTSVTIPDSVTSIGVVAFLGCTNLTSVYYTGDIAGWCGISGLDNIMRYGASDRKLFINGQEIVGDLIVPDGVTSIGDYAFYNYSGLMSVTIGNGVTSIGDCAFHRCSSLTSITIPDSVTSIGGYALNNCSSLTSITIPNSVTSIGEYAFFGCDGLTSVTIPTWVISSIPTMNLKTVVINGGDSIGKRAFYGCTELISVTISDSVTSIGNEAFCNCTGLTSVTIGTGVTSIGFSAFYDCTKLTSATFRNPKGWQECSSNDFTPSKTYGVSSQIASPTTAAQYLRSCGDYLRRV